MWPNLECQTSIVGLYSSCILQETELKQAGLCDFPTELSVDVGEGS